MKKVLSLLMMAMLAFGAWAADETVMFSEQGYSNQQEVSSYTGTDFTVTFNKGTNSNTPKYYTTGAAIRVYGGGYFVVSSSTKTISKIEIGFGSGDGSNAISTDVVTYENGTWTGSASSVTFTIGGTTGHRRIASIAVTFEGSITVTPPTFSPAAGQVVAGTEVTISAPDADMILYTVDGTDPSYADDNGEIYTEPIVVNEAMTIKAIAVDDEGNESSVASAAYTIKPEAVTVATVAEFNALNDATEFTFTGDLVVSGQKNSYLYAQDATGGILIYGSVGQTYNKLDVIPGGWTGKKATYNGAPEAASPAGLTAATTQADLAPEEMTPAQVTLANVFKYAVIRGATVTMTDNNNGTITVGDETVALYKRFNITIPTDGGVYDIIGITGYYNATPQFMPLEFVSQAVVATPVIEGETPFLGSTTVTITCDTEDATIYYTIDGTEPTSQSTAYNEPFELTESATVKAIAYDVTGAASLVASKEFVKTITVASTEEFDALGNGKTFVFTGRLVVSGQKGKYLYAQDEDGGVLIYGTAPTYTKGDVIPAGFTATKTVYNGTVEMTNMTGMEAATEQAEIVAEEVVPADWDEDGINIYAVIKGATIDGSNLVVGENSVPTYNRFGVTAPTDTEKAYDVYGVTSWYNEAPQFYPLEYIEAVEPVVENTITFTAEQENGTIAVSLADGTPVESGVTKVAEGDKVTVTATAAEGYKIATFEVKCGEEVVPFDEDLVGMLKAENTEETHIFTMPADEVTINVTFEETTPTAIETINMENVKTVRYYNVAGVESATPFKGMNIVVREMNDGSKVTTKVIK